tara:strand:+ start:31 stop:531 length:501 start_codon:yes stop_codon:yes gene_type:complete
MDNYQTPMHVPLEEMSHILLGRSTIKMEWAINESLEHDTPMALYSEQSGPGGRLFVGRDYNRMDPNGRIDFRIELLERLVEDIGYETTTERVGTLTRNTGRVETSPLLRLWEINLTPPLREIRVRDYNDAQNGLPYLSIAYVVHQNQDEEIPEAVLDNLRRWERDT